MWDIGGSVLYSATDLMWCMGCANATVLNLSRMSGQRPGHGKDNQGDMLL